jgi:hypothetical protein
MLMQAELRDFVDSIDRPALSEPPAEFREIARKETLHPQGGGERRRHRRYSLITNVIAVPLDNNLCTIGEPFVALSSGMSVGGIRLIHTGPSPTEHLFLEFECQPVRFVLTVLRCRPIGDCFEIAGHLISVDSASQNRRSPACVTANGNAIGRADISVRNDDVFPPSFDELVQWAGLNAAVQILDAELNGNSRRA